MNVLDEAVEFIDSIKSSPWDEYLFHNLYDTMEVHIKHFSCILMYDGVVNQWLKTSYSLRWKSQIPTSQHALQENPIPLEI